MSQKRGDAVRRGLEWVSMLSSPVSDGFRDLVAAVADAEDEISRLEHALADAVVAKVEARREHEREEKLLREKLARVIEAAK